MASVGFLFLFLELLVHHVQWNVSLSPRCLAVYVVSVHGFIHHNHGHVGERGQIVQLSDQVGPSQQLIQEAQNELAHADAVEENRNQEELEEDVLLDHVGCFCSSLWICTAVVLPAQADPEEDEPDQCSLGHNNSLLTLQF